MVNMGIVPHVLYFLNEKFVKNEKLQIEAAWLLANIAAGTSEDTAYLVQQKIIPIFAKTLKFENEQVHENVNT